MKTNQVSCIPHVTKRGFPATSNLSYHVKAEHKSSWTFALQERYAWCVILLKVVLDSLPKSWPEVNCNLPRNFKASAVVSSRLWMTLLMADDMSSFLLSVLSTQTRPLCMLETSILTPRACAVPEKGGALAPSSAKDHPSNVRNEFITDVKWVASLWRARTTKSSK